MSVRGVDTATMSDEHGKGTEVLRTSIVPFFGTIPDGNYPAFAPEADCYIRYVRVVSRTAVADGTVRIQVNPLGSSTANNISANTNVGNTTTNTVQDIAITNPRVPKDSLVGIRIASLNGDIVVQIGWMPDMWNQDANPRTYLSPD